MLKWIGCILIIFGAGGFGIGKTVRFYRQMRQLNELIAALEILKCEMNYTLLPLPELCRLTAERTGGMAEAFLREYADRLEEGLPRTKAVQAALEDTSALCVPNDAQMAILELFGNLGRYDLDGENRLLDLTQKRLNKTLKTCEEERKPLVKGYAALGICTGIALAILLI